MSASFTNASATSSLVATGVADSPSTAWKERIGQFSLTLNMPSNVVAWDATGTLPKVNDEIELALADMTYTLTGDAVEASQTLTLSGNAVAAQTVVIGAKTYTWRASVSTVENEVKIGSTASDSLDNLIAAINGDAGSGTLYGSATVAHTLVTALAGAGDTMDLTAVTAGGAGNAIVTTETMSAGSFAAATLTGGYEAATCSGVSGKNFQGDTIGTKTHFNALEIRILTGSALLGLEGLSLSLAEDGVFTVATTDLASTAFMSSGVSITAEEDNTTFTVTAIVATHA